ncbi:MAG: hypothetical protein IKY73_05090 [Bacteroidaceae bacterium]|nr:hypothetical protein [Bacteroidaceae bacterium]
MKKTLIKTLLCGFLLFFVSCDLVPIGSMEQEVNFGYPESVTLSNEGGVRVFGGNDFYQAIILSSKKPKIREYSGYNDVDSTEYYVFDWLKVEYKKPMRYAGVDANELRIIAEPNTTGKSRELTIQVSQPNLSFQSIKVKQGK